MTLADELQVWGFEKGLTIFGDGSLGFGLELVPIDVSCWDDSKIDNLAVQLNHLLNGLPSGVEVQFVQEIGRGNNHALMQNRALRKIDLGSTVVALHEERLKQQENEDKEGDIPRHGLKIFVRRAPPSNLIERPKFFSKPKSFVHITEHVLEREIGATHSIQNDIIKTLATLEMKPRLLTERETVELIYWQWNPSRPIGLAGFDPEDLRSSLLFSDVAIDTAGFSIGKVHHRIVSLKLLPEHTFATQARILRNLPFDTRLFVTVRVPDQQKELESLQLQRRLAFSMARGKKTGVSDIESETKLQSLESLISDLVAQGEKVFHVSLNILLRSESSEELDSQVSHTLALMRELSGAEGMEESLAAFDIFKELAIPNARAREREKAIKTSNVSDLLPIYGPWRGHEVPRILLKSLHGSLVSIDPFAKELSNFNQILTGGSGSGKSFLTNVLLLQMLKEDPKVFIVDIGGSYKKLCDNLSGQYIPFNLNANFSVNPFDLALGEGKPTSHKIKFLVGLVEMMTKEEGDRRIGRLEQAEIEEAIGLVYREKAPTLSSLREVLLAHKDPNIRKFGKILSPWCGNSPFGKIVDHPTTIALERPIVAFDLKGLESSPDLQAVCLYIITDYVWREIQRDRETMKFLIFDECWKLLENEAGSTFIGEVFRTFRKYYASAIAISQNIDDFAKSRVASAILPNTSLKWVLMQKGADQARLKEVLQLNDTEMAQIAALHQEKGTHSQAFLMAEEKHCVVQIEPTPLEYWIATTDPRDLAAFEIKLNENPSLSQIEILGKLSKEFPFGVANNH